MGANLRLSGAQTGPREESDIRFNYSNLSQIISASTHLGGTQPIHYSGDGGVTWSQANLPAFTGDARQGDPTIDWTSDGTAWSVTIGIITTTDFLLRCFKSTDGGATWSFDSTLTGTQTAMDKEAFWIDHSAASPYKDNMYVTWHNHSPCFVARRAGPGGTWQAPVQVSGAETTGTAVGGDIKTNANGDVFVFWPDTVSRNLFVAKSTDGGATFAAPVSIAKTFAAFNVGIPAQDNRRVLIYLSGGAYRSGSLDLVYATWTDLAGGAGCNSSANEPGSNISSACKTRIWFSRSTDGGATWEAARKINDQSSANDQFFQRLAVDDTTGDLLAVYYDTVADTGRVKADLWMQTSSDNGVTWSVATKVTSAQTDETSAGAQANFQYGDYIGLTGHAGKFFACWTDRRNNGLEEIWGAPLVKRTVTFEIDRDHYGQDEIDALRTQPGGPVVKTAFRIVVDGFTARELGISGTGSTGVGPPITFSPSTGVHATCTSVDSSDPAFPLDEMQRFRFGYDVDFGADDSAFTSFGGATETVALATSFEGLPATAQVVFMKQPDPYIMQGQQAWWLSSDVRLVQVAQGDTRFGVTMGSNPQQFLTDVTTALENGQGMAGGETFDGDTSEDTEVITVAPQTKRGANLVNVYNFAIARVHYQALSQDAAHVRVFFRLFAANSTGTAFHPDTTYRRYPAAYPVAPSNFGQQTTPTTGVISGEYVTIPCFAAQRADPTQAGAPNTLPTLQLQQHPDTLNDRTLAHTGGPKHDSFYGCFLDINQSAGVLPKNGLSPTGNPDGPWPPSSGVVLEPLQTAFIRNAHQCLVAEIAFDPDPIGTGTEPFNSDKLAQRNISWSAVANPGTPASRQALETFEVRPTPDTGPPGTLPDELVINWNDVPRDEQAEVYLPAVDADTILATASQLYPTHRLSRVDAHTIGCLTGGITYIPLPPGTGAGQNFAGLMSIGLPAGIRRGQLYTVLVQQLTNATAVLPPPIGIPEATPGDDEVLVWRRVLGSFQINVPVSTKSELLEKEEILLSIFRWIAESITSQSRWHPVFHRYLTLLARKISALGGDPSKIKPSANGYDGLPERERPPHRPPADHEKAEVTGKVEGLVYDHFGDFEGFILELSDGRTRRFNSREGQIERLVREAWEERILTTVVESGHDPCLPVAVILRRSTAFESRGS